MEKKLIKKVLVDQANMLSTGENRQITVFGEIGAEFNINVIKINGSSKESYYNFITNTFTEAFVSANNLQTKLINESFSTVIIFPADTNGEVYSIKTIAKEQSTRFKNRNFVDTKNITQVGQTNITFQAGNNSSIDSNLISVPNPVASIGSTALSNTVTVPIDWTFQNKRTDGQGFGLRLPTTATNDSFAIPDNLWYSQTVLIANGTQSSVTTINVDDSGIAIPGMELAGVFDGTNKIYVTSVSATTITFSAAVSISDNGSLTLKAYGPDLMKNLFGVEVEFSNFVARGVLLKVSVRTATTFPESNGNVTLNLNGTYGVGGGSHVRLEGFNMNASGNNNLVTTVSASSTAGSVVINYAGAGDDVSKVNIVPIGTKLDVKHSYQDIRITGNIKIKKYPDFNTKVVLDTAQIITVGTSNE